MAAKLSLDQLADKMKGIDIAILSTHTEGKAIANRPMSNNGDVRYDGTSYSSDDGADASPDIE